jgi:hypothetical protein
MNAAGFEGRLNSIAAFTFEFYYEAFLSDGGNFDNYNLIGIHQGNPAANPTAFSISMNGNGCSLGFNCLRAAAYINGSQVHHIALTYDGSTLRLFLDGTIVASTSASGNFSVPPFESFMIGDDSPQNYLGQNAGVSVLPGFLDSVRISNTARYTSNFTPPTAKFSTDSNTILLLNFAANTPTGTMEGLVNNSTNAFIPIETSNGAADLNPVYIGKISLSDNGIWATWMLNSTIENINFPMDSAGRSCVDLWDNDYQDTVRRVFCAIVPAGNQTSVGFLFLNQSNNNVYDHLQCDGQYACIGQVGGSAHYIDPDYTDRGWVYYPLYFIAAQAKLDAPWLDIEDSARHQVASVYSNGAPAPIVINSGQLTSGASGNAYLTISGGAPFIVNGTMFGGGSPAEVLSVLANPTSPVEMRDVSVSGSVASTNSGKSWWLNENLGGQDLGVKFADLPTSVTNGASRYCVDCDPPANPPVACTSAGAKTGAWVNGLSNSWLCVP